MTAESWIEALTEVLLHSLWQGIILAVLLAGVLALCPRSWPEWRYRAGMLAVLMLGLWMVITFCRFLPDDGRGQREINLTQSVAVEPGVTQNGFENGDPVGSAPFGWQTALVSVWLFGAGIFGGRLMIGGFGLASLRKQSTVMLDRDCLRIFEGAKSRVGVRQMVELRLSEFIDSPLAFGFFRLAHVR